MKILFLFCIFLILNSCASRSIASRTPAASGGNQCIEFIDNFSSIEDTKIQKFYYTKKTYEKFTQKQMAEVKNVFDRLKARLQKNTSLEIIDEMNVTIYKRWNSTSAFYPYSGTVKIEVPFCYHLKDFKKEIPDDSAKFVIGHEYGHAIFDKNLVITNSPLWDAEKKAQNYFREEQRLKAKNDFRGLEILEANLNKNPMPESIIDLFEARAADTIITPYDELFADVVGLSEFKEEQILSILHKRVTNAFTKKIAIKGWSDHEEHRYFDPVRSWLWENLLTKNLPEKERDQLSEKIFHVIEAELQEIFTDEFLFKKFLEHEKSIEYFNQRLIDRLNQADL